MSLQKAKTRLVMGHPYFAMTALKMEYIADESVGTMSIGTKNIKYAPSFVQSLHIDELTAVLAHEVLHYLLGHVIRGLGKDHDDWNEACDYVVNAILRKANFKLPANHLYNPRYENMDAEQVYQIIHSKKEKQDQQQDSGDDGEGTGKSQDKSLPQNWGKIEKPERDANIKEIENEIREAAEAAKDSAKKQGKGISEMLEAVLKDVIEPKMSWREILQKFIAEIAKNDYSWQRPNNRYLPSGLYLPCLHSIEVGKVAFAIDTSMSVNDKLLAEFVAEMKEASSIFNFPVTVIHCDTQVRKVEELEFDSNIVPAGRGFTAFQPVFDYVNQEMPDVKALIYFTDGECSDVLKEPHYPVLWVIYNNPRFKAQFGEVIIH